MLEDWPRVSSESLGDYRVFSLRQDRRRSPRTGREHDFYVLEMPEWINVIPVTAENRVVVIRQFRYGTERMSLEIPGGMADAEDGTLEEAARRELVEETGYEATDIISIGHVAANPAIQNNHCHTFLALGARRTGAPQLEDAEDIAVEEVELDAIPALIASGQMDHALVIAGFYWLELYRRENPQHFGGRIQHYGSQ